MPDYEFRYSMKLTSSACAERLSSLDNQTLTVGAVSADFNREASLEADPFLRCLVIQKEARDRPLPPNAHSITAAISV